MLKKLSLFFPLVVLPLSLFAQSDYLVKGWNRIKEADYTEAKNQFSAERAVLKVRKVKQNDPNLIEVEKLIYRCELCEKKLKEVQNKGMELSDASIRRSFDNCSSASDAQAEWARLRQLLAESEELLRTICSTFPEDVVSKRNLSSCARTQSTIDRYHKEFNARIQKQERGSVGFENKLRSDIRRPRLGRKETVAFPASKVVVSSGDNFYVKGASETYFAYVPSEHWGILIMQYDKSGVWARRYLYCVRWDAVTRVLRMAAYDETSGKYVGELEGTFERRGERYYYTAVFTNYKGWHSTTYYIAEDY